MNKVKNTKETQLRNIIDMIKIISLLSLGIILCSIYMIEIQFRKKIHMKYLA